MIRNQVRWSRLAVTALVVSALAGCSRCGKGPAKPAEEFLEKDATSVLVVPSLGGLADHAQALISSTRGGPGGDTIVKLSANLAQQLGFDPLTKDGQKKAGLDPSRGIATSGLSKGEPLVVLPYDDLTKLDATVTRLLKDRVNLAVRKTQKVGELSVVTFSRTEQDKPLFAYTTKGENMLLAQGTDPVATVTKAANRQAAESLSQVAAYQTSKTKIGPRDIYVYNFTSPQPLPIAIPTSNMAGISLASKEFALRLFLPLPEDRSKLLTEVFVGGESGLTKLPANQPIYIRGGIDWAKFLANMESFATKKGATASAQNDPASPNENPIQYIRDRFKQADIDLDTELVGNLQPGFSIAVGVAPTASVSTALNLNPARQNPFENFTVAILGRVKDGAKAKTTMEKLVKLASSIGAQIKTREVAGGTVYTVNYALGEGMSWTLRGNDILVTGGYTDKLAALITSVSSGTQTLKAEQFPPRTKELLFSNQGIALALDMKKVDEAVKGLQSDAGAGSEMIRSAMNSVLSQVSAIKPAIGVTPTQGGVLVDAAISL